MGQKDKTERATGLSRRTCGDIEKWDQTDSPEIPDRSETSENPGLPSGDIFTESKLFIIIIIIYCHDPKGSPFGIALVKNGK